MDSIHYQTSGPDHWWLSILGQIMCGVQYMSVIYYWISTIHANNTVTRKPCGRWPAHSGGLFTPGKSVLTIGARLMTKAKSWQRECVINLVLSLEYAAWITCFTENYMYLEGKPITYQDQANTKTIRMAAVSVSLSLEDAVRANKVF